MAEIESQLFWFGVILHVRSITTFFRLFTHGHYEI